MFKKLLVLFLLIYGISYADTVNDGDPPSGWRRLSGKTFLRVSSDTVGIGTPTPTSSLTISMDAGRSPLNIVSRDTTSIVYIDATKQVGISTLSPRQKLDVIGNASIAGTLSVDSSITASDASFSSMKIGSATYSTLNDAFKLFTSAGRISGGAITDDGTADGKISIASGKGVVRIADDDVSQVKFFDWVASNNQDIPANTTRFIGVAYNGGSPAISIDTTQSWDYDTSFPLGIVVNEADTLHIVNDPWWTSDSITNIIERFQANGRVVRDDMVGGLIIGNTGTRQPTLSAGTVWARLNEFPITALTGGETFDTYYYNGSAWVLGTATQWDNLNYNNIATGLVALGSGKFANLWWYVETDGKLVMVYGQNTYNTAAQAQAGSIPTTLPPRLQYTALFVGRFVFQQNNNTPLSTDSAFDTIFTPGIVADHGNLAGLADDDHKQYVLTSGIRAMSADWDMGSNKVFIGGNVGIGTTGPVSKLDVVGAISCDGISSDMIYLREVLFPTDAPADNDVIMYDAALGRLNFEASASAGVSSLTEGVAGPLQLSATTGAIIIEILSADASTAGYIDATQYQKVTIISSDSAVQDTKIGIISSDVGDLKTKTTIISSDVGTLKTVSPIISSDVGTLKTVSPIISSDVGTLKTKTTIISSDVGTLKNQHLRVTIADPNGFYAISNDVCIMPKTPAALTITKLEATCDRDPTVEMSGDVVWADAFIGTANTTLINTFDTIAGISSDNTITAGSVAANKCIFLQFDAAPSEDIQTFSIDLTYDLD